MGEKTNNIKKLFSNTRTRLIIIFTFIALIVAVLIGVVRMQKHMLTNDNSASVSGSPRGIQSIPGSVNPTQQYANLQNTQNVQQAASALKSGGSAIPTIIRSQQFGDGGGYVGAPDGKGSLGFSTLAQEPNMGGTKSLWISQLKQGNCSIQAIHQVEKAGAGLSVIKQACNCQELKQAGYELQDLKQVCNCKALKAAGFNAIQFKNAGYTAEALRDCGFNACELKNAGFTAQQLKDAGFTDGELKGAGYPEKEIDAAGGLPEGVTAADIRAAGCGVEGLRKLRAEGVSAAAIRRISGCTAAQLKAAGYTAKQLKDAGFTAAELKRAGFDAAQLHAAGFSAAELRHAGFTPAELAQAGYSPAEIASSDNALPPGITPEDVKKAGCSIAALKKEREAGVSAAAIRKYAGCSAAALLAAGYTPDDLKRAGFSPSEIKAAENALKGLPPGVSEEDIKKAGCNPDALRKLREKGVKAATIMRLNHCSAAQLAAAGYTPAEIKAAEDALSGLPPGVTAADIKKAGCNPEALRKLREKGVKASTIRRMSGCTASQLKAAGYTAGELKKAGFTDAQLKAAGFTPAEIAAAEDTLPDGVTAADIKKAGCNPDALRKLRLKGVSAATIKKLNGCSAKQLKAAGYSAGDLLKAGFTPKQLEEAGFTPDQIKNAEHSPTAALAEVKATNCSVEALKKARAAGVTAGDIRKTAGCSAAQMKAAGYTAKELKDAGFTAGELKAAGFTAKQLKDAGFTAKQLKDAGFTAKQLKDAGFSAKQLKDAGFSAKQLKDAGFSARQLKRAGFDADQLKKAGFSPRELANAGFSNKEAGISSSMPGLGDASKDNQILQGIEQAAGTVQPLKSKAEENNEKLQKILAEQRKRFSDQKYQQALQNEVNAMSGAANQAISDWKKAPVQSFTYIGVHKNLQKGGAGGGAGGSEEEKARKKAEKNPLDDPLPKKPKNALVKAGAVMFAILDTSVNSDQPGPVLATMVSGRFRGARLLGSFTLPGDGERLVLSFNKMSVPGAPHTTSISAIAIDPNTARTALSSRTNNHYLLRYGSLFASSFMEGFGNAFQSAGTTITVGGTSSDISVQQGFNRSILENAVIGLTTVGKRWGQEAQKTFNKRPTVELFSGTNLGILFTQDLNGL